MKKPSSAETQEPELWPRKVTYRRETITVYRRLTPSGNFAYMVANYADGRRRFDSYGTEEDALDAANRLAKRQSERSAVAATMTEAEAIEYANTVQRLKAFGVSLTEAGLCIEECLKLVENITEIREAVKFYAGRRRKVTPKSVPDAVKELLELKEAEKVSARYLQDLRHRLNRFAGDCKKNVSDVTTADLQGWLDKQSLASQTYRNFRRVLSLFFSHAVCYGYATENPAAGLRKRRGSGLTVQIYTPEEIIKLLTAAKAQYPEFLPCLAIGAFAGLRSAEIERLHWKHVVFGSHIEIGADIAKTQSRRPAPFLPNLGEWLADYAKRKGPIFKGAHEDYYRTQQAIAQAAGFEWKDNGLRHSFGSYRLAHIKDAPRVAFEMGNSPAVVHRHYKALVTEAEAKKWFGVKPEQPGNVVSLQAAQGRRAQG